LRNSKKRLAGLKRKMKSNKILRALVILVILGLNIGCDQVTKTIARHKLQPFDYITFLHNHVQLARVENTGAFLSLGDSSSGWVKMIFLNILPLLAVIVGLVYVIIRTELDRVTVLAIILIIGGGFGNIYDRLRYGSVTDFMHIDFGIFQTGVFNVADMSIMAGTFIILLHAWLKKKPEEPVVDATEPPTE
jgi:signal peptidase II